MSDHPILLIGSTHDAHIETVARCLEERGVDVLIVDMLAFPERPAIKLGERLDDITIDGRDLARPSALYLRDIYVQPLGIGVDIEEEMAQDWRRTLVAFREKAHVLLSLLGRWTELGVPAYNPMSADWRLSKPMQLSMLERAGLPVPPTIWTNDPQTVRTFAAGQRVAYKPVVGGAATQELGPEDLTDARLGTLRGAPVTFQKLLPGDNYRVYCLDGEVIATLRIGSKSLDYRQNEDLMEEAELPSKTEQQCLRAAEVLGLRWTGIDLKRDDEGNLQFLEANSSPMFLGFDARGGTKILDALVSALASHAS